jgi:hypothetical protein
MGKSGNPARAAQQAEALRISQVGDFKKRLGGVMELPSGLVVKAKNPGGLRAFLNSGLIPNSLMKIIQEGLDKGSGKNVAINITKDGKIDPEMLTDMMSMMDNIAVQVVVEPQIFPTITEADLEKWNGEHPENEPMTSIEQLRRDDRLYADELPDDDKMFLFQWVSGGTKDLETFRRQHAAGVDDLSASTGDEDTAE